jgi:hypothetical protein
MSVPKGGRGHKADYSTTVVRVPDPVLSKVTEIIETFRESGIQHESSSTPGQAQAIELAREILKQKKSAKVSLVKLLQVLYNTEDINL